MQALSSLSEWIIFPCWVQIKYDGIRAEIVDGDVLTKSGKSLPNTWLKKRLLAVNPIGYVGEIVCGDFGMTQSKVMSQDEAGFDYQYHVFDNTSVGGAYRNRWLSIPHGLKAGVCIVNSYEELVELEQEFADQGEEGIVIRDPNGTLEVKYKRFQDSEGFIFGTEPHSKRPEIVGALWVQWNGIDFKLGSGLTEEERVLFAKESPVGKLANFRYQGIYPKTGKPRWATFARLRDERDV